MSNYIRIKHQNEKIYQFIADAEMSISCQSIRTIFPQAAYVYYLDPENGDVVIIEEKDQRLIPPGPEWRNDVEYFVEQQLEGIMDSKKGRNSWKRAVAMIAIILVCGVVGYIFFLI